jgi:hypothetical protein
MNAEPARISAPTVPHLLPGAQRMTSRFSEKAHEVLPLIITTARAHGAEKAIAMMERALVEAFNEGVEEAKACADRKDWYSASTQGATTQAHISMAIDRLKLPEHRE